MCQLSVIIPVYNASKYLHQCFDSIIKQEYQDYEIILVDDGSKDDSPEICQRFALAHPQFSYHRQENQGPAAARNLGMKLAHGEYICFIDADDWVEPDYFAHIMAPETLGKDALFWGYSYDKKELQEIRKPESAQAEGESVLDLILRLKQQNMFGYSVNCRFKRDIIRRYGLEMPVNVKLHEDNIFTNHYCSHIKDAMAIDYAGYHYIILESSLCRRKFFPSIETFNIAQLDLESINYCLPHEGLRRRELHQYISYLLLSVHDMYDHRDVPVTTTREKINRIKFVKKQVCKYYADLQGNRQKSIVLFRYVPYAFLHLIYSLQNKKAAD